MPQNAPEQTVYSYLTPEMQRVLRDGLREITRVNQPDHLIELLGKNVTPGLDGIEDPLFDQFERFGRLNGVIGWDEFDHRYFTNGSNEGLWHLLVKFIREYRAEHHGTDPTICVLEGEYQGFKAYVNALDCSVREISENELRSGNQGGPCDLFVYSHPSSRDGNLLSHAVLDSIHAWADYVIIDLAYMGMTDPLDFALTRHRSRVYGVVGSMSKPFGMYYFRIGFCWGREPLDSLYGNRWFKNIHSIKLAKYVLENFDYESYREHYRIKQEEAIRCMGDQSAYTVLPSDVWLLAYADNGPQEYVRANDRSRFCLTPIFQEMEHEG